MELFEITLNLGNLEAIGAIAVAIVTLFGAPYIVRAQNKKHLDAKVDKTEFYALQEEVGKKVDTISFEKEREEVSKDFEDIKQDVRDHKKSMDARFDGIQNQLTSMHSDILNAVNSIKKGK